MHGIPGSVHRTQVEHVVTEQLVRRRCSLPVLAWETLRTI